MSNGPPMASSASAASHCARGATPSRRGVGARDVQRRRAGVRADARRVRQLARAASAAGSPMPVPTSRMRSGRAGRPFSADQRERGLDQRLAVGSRIERRRRDGKAAAIELALAENARHGLARDAPRQCGGEDSRPAQRLSCRSGRARICAAGSPSSGSRAGGARRRPRRRCRLAQVGALPAAGPRRASGPRASPAASRIGILIHGRQLLA